MNNIKYQQQELRERNKIQTKGNEKHSRKCMKKKDKDTQKNETILFCYSKNNTGTKEDKN